MSFFDAYRIIKKKKLFVPDHKIYLSISSEGLGHSSRALAIVKEFAQDETVVGTYNYALDRFKNNGYNCAELPQELRLVGTKGAFDVKKTILKNRSSALIFNDIINEEIEVIREHNASCVVADGRLAPVMAAEKLSLPCIVITNQSAFYPFFAKDSALIRVLGKSFDWLMKTWLSSAEEIMIPDFPPPYTVCLGSLSKNFKVMKRTRFVGPLVSFDADDVEEIAKPAEKYVVVALGGHSYRKPLFDSVLEAARKLKDYHFDLFCSFTATEVPENVRIFNNIQNIAPYLKAADLVITQAGHSTAMELLTLGKPAIIVPDFRQIEQENNAARMEVLKTAIKLDYTGILWKKLVEGIIKVNNDPKYSENAQKFKIMAKEINGSRNAANVIREYSARLRSY